MWMILLGGVYTAGLKKHLAIDLLAQNSPRTPALVLDGIIRGDYYRVRADFYDCTAVILLLKSWRTSAKCPGIKMAYG